MTTLITVVGVMVFLSVWSSLGLMVGIIIAHPLAPLPEKTWKQVALIVLLGPVVWFITLAGYLLE